METPRPSPLPLYVGGFMGPFGGAVLAVLIPELQVAFHASAAAVALAIPAYLVPFAVLQLVSGTIGERLGIRRVVRAGYLGYAACSLAAAAAPGLGAFIACRAGQGVANAFLTPLLLAALPGAVAADRLAAAVGTFAAVQTGALAFSPLIGGIAGALSWRLPFVVSALVAVALAFVPPADEVRAPGGRRPGFGMLVRPAMGLLALAGFAGYCGVTGIGVIVSLRATDAFALGSVPRGLLLAGFGAAGMILGRPAGHVVDRLGRARTAMLGAVACALAVAALGVAGSAAWLAAVWFAAGAASVLMWTGLNTIAIEAIPENRGGTTSVFSAFKFAGNAAAPLLWLPLYERSPEAAFVACALVSLSIVATAGGLLVAAPAAAGVSSPA